MGTYKFISNCLKIYRFSFTHTLIGKRWALPLLQNKTKPTLLNPWIGHPHMECLSGHGELCKLQLLHVYLKISRTPKPGPAVARVTNKTKLQTQIVNCLSHWPFNNTLPTAKRGQGDKTKQNSTPQHSSILHLLKHFSNYHITFIIIHMDLCPPSQHLTHSWPPIPTPFVKLHSIISFSIYEFDFGCEASKWKKRSVSFSGTPESRHLL